MQDSTHGDLAQMSLWLMFSIKLISELLNPCECMLTQMNSFQCSSCNSNIAAIGQFKGSRGY